MSTEVTAGARMTAEEFADFVQRPENANRWFELVRGEVIELPPPIKIHGAVCGNFARILGNYTVARGAGYITTNDSGVILEREPDTVRGPDVALYEDAQAFEELHPKYGEVPPILAVEVLSPNDKPGRVNDKIADYLNAGVKLVWLVDPELRSVTVYRPDRRFEIVRFDGELDGGEVLPGFRCKVADFFFVPGKKEPPKEKDEG